MRCEQYVTSGFDFRQQTPTAHRYPSIPTPFRMQTSVQITPVCVARALFKALPESERELSFDAGDLIQVLHKTDDEWWYGAVGERKGYFPCNLVEVVDDQTLKLITLPVHSALSTASKPSALQSQPKREAVGHTAITLPKPSPSQARESTNGKRKAKSKLFPSVPPPTHPAPLAPAKASGKVQEQMKAAIAESLRRQQDTAAPQPLRLAKEATAEVPEQAPRVSSVSFSAFEKAKNKKDNARHVLLELDFSRSIIKKRLTKDKTVEIPFQEVLSCEATCKEPFCTLAVCCPKDRYGICSALSPWFVSVYVAKTFFCMSIYFVKSYAWLFAVWLLHKCII